MSKLIIILLISLAIILFSLYRIGYFSQEKEVLGSGYYVGNFHTHTTASDGILDYNQVITEALKLNFSFIVFTDHNVISPTVALLCPNDKRILCVVGEEISTLDGHVLAIGITSPVPYGLGANETIKLIHEQAGLAIPAHPGIDLGINESLLSLDWDAIECNSSLDPLDQETGCNNTEPKVYDSDAHNAIMLGTSSSECFLLNLTIDSLKASVKAGNCTLNNINK